MLHREYRRRSAPSILPQESLVHPKIGLALSGGGIRGVAQIGVLKVLEEENIPIDLIVGTSIGGVIGGLYASGYSPDEMMELARSIDWAAVLSDTPQRSSLFLGEKEKRGLRRHRHARIYRRTQPYRYGS